MSIDHYAGLLVGFLVDSHTFFAQLRLATPDPTPRVGSEVDVPVLGGLSRAYVTKLTATGEVERVRFADRSSGSTKLTKAQRAALKFEPATDQWRTPDDRTVEDSHELLAAVGQAFNCQLDLVGNRYGYEEGFGLVGITLSDAEWTAVRARAGAHPTYVPASEGGGDDNNHELNPDGCADDLDVLAEARPGLAALRARLVAAGFPLPTRPAAYAIPEEG